MNRTTEGEPATTRLWSLSEDALVEVGLQPDSLTVVSRWGESTVSGGVRTLQFLQRMALGPVALTNAAGRPAGALTPADVTDLADLDRVLDELSGSVVHSLGLPDGQSPIMSALPAVATPTFRARGVPAARQVRLSRFCAMWRNENGLTMDMPGAPFRVRLAHPIAWRVASALAVSSTVAEVAGRAGAPEQVVRDMASFLIAAGVVLMGDRDGQFAEDGESTLRPWAPHELLFHARSRTRHTDSSSEAAVRYAQKTPSPLMKPAPDGQKFPLYRPSVEELAVTDPTLTTLLEDDHCCPHFTEEGISAEGLGELLYRSARIRSVGPAYLPVNLIQETTQRPYFNIGCLYELEIYLSLHRCAGLPRAIYHYNPLDHELTLINKDQASVDAMLDIAKVAAGSRQQPAALITVTARMGRTSWLLDGAAYATALMHLGTLQQTLYLSGKAMGISTHGVTIDSSDTVDRVLGLEWPAEVAVGECVIDSFA